MNNNSPSINSLVANSLFAKIRCVLVLLLVTLNSGCPSRINQPGPETNDPAAITPEQEQTSSNEWQTQIASVSDGTTTEIIVSSHKVSLKDLDALRGTLNVTELLLDAGAVTDAGMPILASLGALEHLRLRESPISDRGIEILANGNLDSLHVLNLPQANLGSAGISQLFKFPGLMQLRLGGSQIDDAAVREIARLPELRSLHLIGPSLSDASLDALAEAPKLASFYLDDCELSDEAWQRLFSAKPKLHVHIDQAHHDRDPGDHPH